MLGQNVKFTNVNIYIYWTTYLSASRFQRIRQDRKANQGMPLPRLTKNHAVADPAFQMIVVAPMVKSTPAVGVEPACSTREVIDPMSEAPSHLEDS